MKNLFIALLAVLVASCGFNQNKKVEETPEAADAVEVPAKPANWTEELFPADELKGTPEELVSRYDCPITGNAFFYFKGDVGGNITLLSKQGIFDYQSGRPNDYVKVVVGLYENGELKKKIDAKFSVGGGDADIAVLLDKKISGEIAEHLKNTGDIRIVAPRYSGLDYDVTIPNNPDLKL